MLYSIARKLLFTLDPEISHSVSLGGISCAGQLGLLPSHNLTLPQTVMGIRFPNPVGLSAGLDKNGDHFEGLLALGFGFVEIGTLTPKPQLGNPQPRLFRLPENKAIINRMGFNNKGIQHAADKLKSARENGFSGIVGVNVGKNKLTTEENAVDDYLFCMEKVYEYSDYIAVNISSPNTPGLRGMQEGEQLIGLLSGLKEKQLALESKYQRYVPVLVKIAPDLDKEQIDFFSEQIILKEIDGVIATNTTISRAGVEGHKYSAEAGGLSGLPVQEKSDWVLNVLNEKLHSKVPVVGVGGIMSPQAAIEKFNSGAQLVQIYTGFIYEGPKLITDILKLAILEEGNQR